jgi:hypothetical protein
MPVPQAQFPQPPRPLFLVPKYVKRDALLRALIRGRVLGFPKVED